MNFGSTKYEADSTAFDEENVFNALNDKHTVEFRYGRLVRVLYLSGD